MAGDAAPVKGKRKQPADSTKQPRNAEGPKQKKSKKFSGRNPEVNDLIEYLKQLRASLEETTTLNTEGLDFDTLSVLSRRLITELPWQRLQEGLKDQACSRQIEWMMKLLRDQLNSIITAESLPDRDSRLEVIGLTFEHFHRAVTRDGRWLSRNQYASHAVEILLDVMGKLLGTEPRYLGHLHRWVELCMEVEKTSSADPSLRQLILDPRASFVIRKILAAVGDALKVEDTAEGERKRLVDRAARNCLHMFTQPHWERFLFEKCYTSQAAAPVLLEYYSFMTKLDDTYLREDQRDLFRSSVLPKDSSGTLDTKALDRIIKSPVGCRLLEFICQKVLGKTEISDFVKSYLKEEDRMEKFCRKDCPLAFYVMKGLVLNTNTRSKQLIELLDSINWQNLDEYHEAVYVAMVERISELGQPQPLQSLLKRFEEPFQWASLCSSPPRLRIATLLAKTGTKKLLGQEVFDRLVLLEGVDVIEVAQSKAGALFIQAVIQRLPGKAVGELAAKLASNPDMVKLAFNPYGSYVVGSIYERVQSEERRALDQQMKPCLSELRARNFSLFKRLTEAGQLSVGPRPSREDSRFLKQ